MGEKWGGDPNTFSPILAVKKNFTSVFTFLGGKIFFYISAPILV